MVVARSNEAHARLQALVRNRAIERHYAPWSGEARSRAGRIEARSGPIVATHYVTRRHDKPREADHAFEVRELCPVTRFLT